MESPWVTDFKENTLYRIDESTRMVEIAFAKAASFTHPKPVEDLIWKRPNPTSNSIGNLILHLCGNMTQYVISSLGEQEDTRDRDVEFETSEGFTAFQLLEKLKETVTSVKETIQKATEAQLLKKRNVQGFYFSGMGCVIHAVEHYSYHTGQIAFWVKQVVNRPLGFYDGQDLNVKNECGGTSDE
ncbi:DinB family protein [Dokdonia ponticola]|uniref:DinB family protein n=1 Tax=Dokdonia ponticola TaxID=2041041 RepID=A0ABV9I352_9FLAO